VNPHISEPSAAEIALRGGNAKSVRASVIAASDIHAHNTFDRPDTVRQRDASAETASGVVTHTFPPASVTRLTVELA
jgi:alpha-N-arabinofuranosidase